MATPNGILKFSATWCGPCKKIASDFRYLKSQNPHVTVREYDADDDDEVCKQYSVSHLPTFIAIRDGQIVGRVTGASMPDVEKLFTMFDF